MKNEKNVIDELWGIWYRSLCTFNSLGSVLLLAFGSEKITRELTILEGQPPYILKQSHFMGNQFAIFFIFKLKLGNPKNELFGVDKCLVFEHFLPKAVF